MTGNRGRAVGKGPCPPKKSEPKPTGAAMLLFRYTDEPADMVSGLRTEYDLGRLTVTDAIDVAQRIADLWPTAEEIEQLENLRDEVNDTSDGLRVCQWQLAVALKALDDLRQVCGTFASEVSACLGRLTSTTRKPSESAVAEYDEKCSRVLDELNIAVSESCLRPGRDEDFRDVAERIGLLADRPNL